MTFGIAVFWLAGLLLITVLTMCAVGLASVVWERVREFLKDWGP